MGDDQQFSVPVHHPNSLGSPSLDGSQPIQNQQPAQNNVFDYSLSCPPELHRLRDARELVLSSSMGLLVFICFIHFFIYVYVPFHTEDGLSPCPKPHPRLYH